MLKEGVPELEPGAECGGTLSRAPPPAAAAAEDCSCTDVRGLATTSAAAPAPACSLLPTDTCRLLVPEAPLPPVLVVAAAEAEAEAEEAEEAESLWPNIDSREPTFSFDALFNSVRSNSTSVMCRLRVDAISIQNAPITSSSSLVKRRVENRSAAAIIRGVEADAAAANALSADGLPLLMACITAMTAPDASESSK